MVGWEAERLLQNHLIRAEQTRNGASGNPTLSQGRYIPPPVLVLPLAAPVAEPASGRIELTAPGTANREGGPTPVAEAGTERSASPGR